MTNKELNATIKKELKDAGYNTRDFSISVKDVGYSTSIKIKIKSPEVNRMEVKELLKHHEFYERDQRTYEILEGGNNYLSVEYQEGVFDAVSQEWATTAHGIMNSKDETTKIFDDLYLINWEHRGRLEIIQQGKHEYCRRICNNFTQLCVFMYKFAKFGSIAV